MALLDYTIKIIEAFANEWLQGRNYAAGSSGTGGTSDTRELKKPMKIARE
jgi:hypothetical protein